MRLSGRRTEQHWREYLTSEGIPLSREAVEAETVRRQYQDWLLQETRTLFIPGLGRELPVTAAWLRLQARKVPSRAQVAQETIEAQVEAYRQWGQRDGVEPENSIDAEHLTELGSRHVIIGGPGAGKSTLLRYVAHQKSREGRLVARVHLKLVALRIQRGDTFDEALSRVASDGSGLSAYRCEELLAHPEFLLADGLDECGADAPSIGDALRKWSHGHQGTTLLVTTRPVGYEAERFSDWLHLELLPLNREEIAKHARQLLQIVLPAEQVEAALRRLESTVENHQASSIAARNPLLLGFLTSLVSQNRLRGTRRVGLYREIFSLAEQKLSREGAVEAPPDIAVSRHILEQAAWELQETPVMSSDILTRRLGADLARRLQVDAIRGEVSAGQALEFWERQRLIERLRAGTAEVHVFVHASFGEFAAARRWVQMPVESREMLVAQMRRQPRWHEVLLLAAGLQPDSVIPPCSHSTTPVMLSRARRYLRPRRLMRARSRLPS
nr:NACHT domain-containing protein [Myxococcus sp. RHSTA-1-4]